MAFFKNFLLFFTLFISFQLLMVQSVEFEVGEKQGWVVPSSKDNQVYNEWASKHRFQVGDNIHFKYEKDSVLVVTEQEYEKCRSAHPVFFSNNGNTDYKFDHPGLYYFISGVTGHCERGLKMIIKVLDTETLSPPSGGGTNGTAPSNDSHDQKKNAAVGNGGIGAVQFVVLSLFGFLFA